MTSGDRAGGSLTLVSHYLKQEVFRNDGGPSGLTSTRPLDLTYDLLNRRMDHEHAEVELTLRAKSGDGAPVFLLEVTYAGLFHLQEIPTEAVPSAFFVNAPALLFPYVREMVADTMQKGGLPPLKLEPVDFAALYRADTGREPAGNITIVSTVAGQPALQPEIRELFATSLYGAPLGVALESELEAACLKLASEDEAGRAWCKAARYRGYTSHASIYDLPARAPVFARLTEQLERHVAAFARAVAFDMEGRQLVLDSIWVNVMQEEAAHPAHIHPHAAVSGTYYVTVPPDAAAIYFDDPRAGLMMAAPPRAESARLENRDVVTMQPKAGNLLLWESWLRHGVEVHASKSPRISISFNYRVELRA